MTNDSPLAAPWQGSVLCRHCDVDLVWAADGWVDVHQLAHCSNGATRRHAIRDEDAARFAR